jgi:2-polyprenyl-3-methyl-5-hydroxy-6-metoxy-1,4-benzoquinol methylase
MKNIIDEKPFGTLTGRHLKSVNFVSEGDVRGKKILDIGCGYGWCEVAFLDKDPKSITGIEISERDLATIRKNVTDSRISTEVSGATSLPFQDASFDTVVSWEVIEHIPVKTESLMFSEANRVLKPGGSFYLSTPHWSFFSNLLDPAWLLVGHRHYSRGRLARYARNAGLSVERVEIRGGWWSLFSLVNMYVAKWVFRRTSFYNDVFVRKEDAEYNDSSDGFANIFVHFKKPA